MVEKIKQHFNEIFADAPKTRMALDLKQEMMQSAIDKYNDMVADGYSEEDAYQNVVSSIGLPKCRICTHCFDGSSHD